MENLTYGTLPTNPWYSVCLRCLECCDNFSAARADYFANDPEETLTCTRCGSDLELVKEITSFRPVSLGRADNTD